MTKLIAVIFVFLMQCFSAFASQSNWVETEGGAMRLVLSDDTVKPARGFLEIKLNQGWKTYWRDPGDGGIPPSLIADGKTITLLFPAPDRINENGQVFSGYHDTVKLPFLFPENLVTGTKFSAFIGICSEICVPFQAELDADISQANAISIDQAFALLPQPAAQSGATVNAERQGDYLYLNFNPETAHPELFLAPEKGVYFDVPEASAAGFKVKILKEKSRGITVNYTLKSDAGAFSGTFEMPR